MATATYTKCVHGMIWKTCQLCKDKSESQVLAELQFQLEEQKSKLIYDYQEAVQDMPMDADLAYDIDDMGM
jgi:hypothetical protein